MPYLKIQTNCDVTDIAKQAMMKKISHLVAENLGKPEKYVMVRFDPVQPMVFAGNADPCVFLELKSIGLPDSKTEPLSQMLCQFVNDELKVSPERVYIEFANAKDSMWGWNGGTF